MDDIDLHLVPFYNLTFFQQDLYSNPMDTGGPMELDGYNYQKLLI